MFQWAIKFDPTTQAQTWVLPVSLVPSYLKLTTQAALQAQSAAEGEEVAVSAIQAITFAAFAIEAAANQCAVGIVPDNEMESFQFSKDKYKTGWPKGISSTAWKWIWLLRKKGWTGDQTAAPVAEVVALFAARNELAHYEAVRYATRIRYEHPLRKELPGVGVSYPMQPPVDEPHEILWGAVHRLLSRHRAARSYMAARDVLSFWNGLHGGAQAFDDQWHPMPIPAEVPLPTRLAPGDGR